MTRAATILVAVFVLTLTACGGGSGGPAPPAQSTPRTTPLEYGYFGIDGDQIRETSASVTFVMAPDWGDWSLPDYDAFRASTAIMQLQEAKARGVPHAWLAIGWLVFTSRPGCLDFCYTPRPDAIARLHAFKAQLDALGLYPMVTALYPVDEPELHGLADPELEPLLRAIKAEWPALLAVIYGDTRTYPGLRMYDLIGRDDYGKGARVLDELPPITGSQQWLLVPGGASGLSDHGPDDPGPFYDFAARRPEVYAIVPFVWFDRGNDRGIRSNGMAPSYTATGCKITARC